ncbi:hypothetical protein ACFQX7_11665 [Luedemannella flava]
MDELRRAAELAAEHLAGVVDRPVWQPVPAGARAWLADQALPDRGRPLDALLDDIRDHVMPYPMGNGHPRFFGWVNSPRRPPE